MQGLSYETTFMYLLFTILLLIQFQGFLTESQTPRSGKPVAAPRKVQTKVAEQASASAPAKSLGVANGSGQTKDKSPSQRPVAAPRNSVKTQKPVSVSAQSNDAFLPKTAASASAPSQPKVTSSVQASKPDSAQSPASVLISTQVKDSARAPNIVKTGGTALSPDKTANLGTRSSSVQAGKPASVNLQPSVQPPPGPALPKKEPSAKSQPSVAEGKPRGDKNTLPAKSSGKLQNNSQTQVNNKNQDHGPNQTPNRVSNQVPNKPQVSTSAQANRQPPPQQSLKPLNQPSPSVLSPVCSPNLNLSPNLPTNTQTKIQSTKPEQVINNAPAQDQYQNQPPHVIVQMVPQAVYQKPRKVDSKKDEESFLSKWLGTAVKGVKAVNNWVDEGFKIQQPKKVQRPKKILKVVNTNTDCENENDRHLRKPDPARSPLPQPERTQQLTQSDNISNGTENATRPDQTKFSEEKKVKELEDEKELQKKKNKQLKILALIGIPVLLIFSIVVYYLVSGENPMNLITGGKSGFGGKHVVIIVMIILTVAGMLAYFQISKSVDISEKISGEHRKKKGKRKKDGKRNMSRLSATSTIASTSRASTAGSRVTSTASCAEDKKKWEKYMKKNKKCSTISNAGSAYSSAASASRSIGPLSKASLIASSMVSAKPSSVVTSNVSTATSKV